jgi:thiol-disulfide isomerase/thioredoxin
MSRQTSSHADGLRQAAPSLFRLLLFPLLVVVARADVKVGDTFPDLHVPGISPLAGGEIPKTAGAVVLVDFWASWCTPCKASFPAMARLHADFHSRGLVIVAVSVDERPADAVQFAKKLAPPFVTLHDRDHNLVKSVAVPTMPTSYLLGRDGRVRYLHSGYHGISSDKELRAEIGALLNESK